MITTSRCPCLGCTRRPDCKGCEPFSRWREENAKAREARRAEQDFKSYEQDRYTKIRRWKHKHLNEGLENQMK